MATAAEQLAGRCSLRDIVSNLSALKPQPYHLGIGPVARSSVARVNAAQPRALCEEPFGRLLALPDGGAGARLPVPQPAPLARFDDHRPVPVGVPAGEVPAGEGRDQAARGIYSDHIAQHILMFMLALARGLPYWLDAQREGRWRAASWLTNRSATWWTRNGGTRGALRVRRRALAVEANTELIHSIDNALHRIICGDSKGLPALPGYPLNARAG